jgi:hypothetical protein
MNDLCVSNVYEATIEDDFNCDGKPDTLLIIAESWTCALKVMELKAPRATQLKLLGPAIVAQ